jgi:hypothetical protein
LKKRIHIDREVKRLLFRSNPLTKKTDSLSQFKKEDIDGNLFSIRPEVDCNSSYKKDQTSFAGLVEYALD